MSTAWQTTFQRYNKVHPPCPDPAKKKCQKHPTAWLSIKVRYTILTIKEQYGPTLIGRTGRPKGSEGGGPEPAQITIAPWHLIKTPSPTTNILPQSRQLSSTPRGLTNPALYGIMRYTPPALKCMILRHLGTVPKWGTSYFPQIRFYFVFQRKEHLMHPIPLGAIHLSYLYLSTCRVPEK